MNSGRGSTLFRKSLVVFQFSLSVILLIGTIVAFQQVQYMRSMKVGYEKDHLIYIPLRGEATKSYTALKDELSRTPNVVNVSGINRPFFNSNHSAYGANWDGKDPNFNPLICTASIDYNYIETMKIKMLEGRSFSKSFPTDSLNGFIVNEEVLKLMETKSGLGKNFNFLGVNGQIVGVMKNFQFQSIKVKVEPLALLFASHPQILVARLQGGNIPAAIDNVKSVWENLVPQYPFEYKFFDEDFAEMYKSDEQMGNIFKYGAGFAIFIACLGLFGFASFVAEKRTKEIGIRKTLGASTSGLTILLSKEFVKWVLIANLIAWPIAYLLTNNWLQNYAYRISIEWWMFVLAGIITVLISTFTVSFQAIRTAQTNPVKSLRSE